eukprot:6229417-Amphidinium_carterae.1
MECTTGLCACGETTCRLRLSGCASRIVCGESFPRLGRVLAFGLAIIFGAFKAVSVLCRGKRH